MLGVMPRDIHKIESEAKSCCPATRDSIQKGPIENLLWTHESTGSMSTVQETADLQCSWLSSLPRGLIQGTTLLSMRVTVNLKQCRYIHFLGIGDVRPWFSPSLPIYGQVCMLPLEIWFVRPKEYIGNLWCIFVLLLGLNSPLCNLFVSGATVSLESSGFSSGTRWYLTKVLHALKALDPEHPAWSL